LIGEVKPKKHIVFVDDETQLESFDPAQHFDTAPELVNRAHNRLRTQQLHEIVDSHQNIIPEQEQLLVGKKRKLTPQVRELKQRSKRAKKLEEAYFELSQQRNVARLKGSKKKLVLKKEVGGKEKEVVVYKWRNERSK
jgi:U3 small nucleolar RNA-associated protein 11